jgi:hypothetical protein
VAARNWPRDGRQRSGRFSPVSPLCVRPLRSLRVRRGMISVQSRPPPSREARANGPIGQLKLPSQISAVSQERRDCGSRVATVPGQGFVYLVARLVRFCAHVSVLLCCCHSRPSFRFRDVASMFSMGKESRSAGRYSYATVRQAGRWSNS